MRLLLVGGGTLGSVSPLIAIFEELQEKGSRFESLWVGTEDGPERTLVAEYNITYCPIPAGKLRRYFSVKNFTDLLSLMRGFWKSVWILLQFRPDVIIGAGSFVQVPIIAAAHCFSRKTKIIIHQQDVTTGLANQICARWADLITTSAEQSLNGFNTIFTGNPYRKEILKGDVARAFEAFKLEPNLPTILVLGGGTGALAINELVTSAIPRLTKFCQIIHITGRHTTNAVPVSTPRYHLYEIMTTLLKDAYAAADLVISRAGFATITELAALAKPSIIIPMPETHQEANAQWLAENSAAVVLSQKTLTSEQLTERIRELLQNKEELFELSSRISNILPKNANERFLRVVMEMTEQGIKVKQW